MEKSSFPVFESADNKLKNEINTKLSKLLKQGVLLDDIVELLDAQEFLEHIETGKRHSDVAHFDVDSFIKKRTSENRKFSLPEEYIKIDETILPPSELEPKTGTGNGRFKETGIIPRSTMLMETLTEMGLKYSVIEGKNDSRMVRKLSYLIFIISSMQKLILVNDEENNATFVIHKAQPEEWKDYMKMTKSELSEMPDDLVSSFIYTNKEKEGHEKRWKDKIKNFLINGTQYPDASSGIEKAPDGWMTAFSLSRKLDVVVGTMQNESKQYRQVNPEWFKIYKNVQGKEVEHYSPELIKIILKKYEENIPAPEGWVTAHSLSKKLGVDPITLKNYSDKYRLSNPNYFKNYISSSGSIREHYAPQLVDILFYEYGKIESAPRGWLTAGGLSKITDLGSDTINKFAKNYRIEHPEWIKTYKNNMGQRIEHFHPELLSSIKEEYEKIKTAPEGWLTAFALAGKLGTTHYTIVNYAEQYKIKHPEWFKNYRDDINNIREHYSPELIKAINNEYKQFKSVPENWKNIQTLLKEIKTSKHTLRSYAKLYRQEHPNWFKMHENSDGLREIYYHPDLIELIRDKFKNNIAPPSGWMMNEPLSKLLHSDTRSVKGSAENYRLSCSEWFKNFTDSKGRLREYYSPELVEIIKSKLRKNTNKE